MNKSAVDKMKTTQRVFTQLEKVFNVDSKFYKRVPMDPEYGVLPGTIDDDGLFRPLADAGYTPYFYYCREQAIDTVRTFVKRKNNAKALMNSTGVCILCRFSFLVDSDELDRQIKASFSFANYFLNLFLDKTKFRKTHVYQVRSVTNADKLGETIKFKSNATAKSAQRLFAISVPVEVFYSPILMSLILLLVRVPILGYLVSNRKVILSAAKSKSLEIDDIIKILSNRITRSSTSNSDVVVHLRPNLEKAHIILNNYKEFVRKDIVLNYFCGLNPSSRSFHSIVESRRITLQSEGFLRLCKHSSGDGMIVEKMKKFEGV